MRFSYISGDDQALLGIVTKVGGGEINILWILENNTHTVSYKDFEHAIKNGVYEIVEEST